MADPAALAAAREGGEALAAFRAESTRTLDLTGADLAGVNLAGADLGDARLDGVDFSGANLQRVRFNSASIRGASFVGADLRGVSFHKCDLTGSDLRDALCDTWGVGKARLCISPQSFQGVHWSREQITSVLNMINLNPDWRVEWSIAPREGG
jgi:uncharacterized protein YjbI with pentapeptide repeats